MQRPGEAEYTVTVKHTVRAVSAEEAVNIVRPYLHEGLPVKHISAQRETGVTVTIHPPHCR